MRKLVHGVGVNDADYNVQKYSKGKYTICPYYSKWVLMLWRCYDPDVNNVRPTYRDCTVCDEWLVFSNFKAWMEKQDWMGKQLDKDIIIDGNKVYCPEACAFVSQRTNTFVLKKYQKTDMPLGVHYETKRGNYTSNISINGKAVRLGRFDTAEEAHEKYKERKREMAIEIASEESDPRICKAILERFSFN